MRAWGILSAATLLAIGAPAAAQGSAQPLSIDDIVALSGAGLGDDAIVAKIKSSNTHYDLSTGQMLDLRRKGVSSPVIAALITAAAPAPAVLSVDSPDPMANHALGFYLLPTGANKMVRIDPVISNQAKTGGIWGYALTYGIASASIKVAIQNDTARVHATDARPVFYAYFDESLPDNAHTGAMWMSGMGAITTSPSEFTLVRLAKKDGRREARVGSMNIGGAKTGVMDKDRIAFSYDVVRPGVFRVTPGAPLPPGEYGFIVSIAGGGTGGAMNARVFDFSI